ncbi:hypothetical protein [Actinoplanes sp. NPDC049118]|uniref:hypothetical protein n=1 Tax=Actinoplanes sp. NPDC049118 TaxID=3155769 RepID=UPI003407DA4A
MLVPVFGIASAAAFLGEAVHGTDLAGGVLVVGGVLLGAGGSGRTPEVRRATAHADDANPAPAPGEAHAAVAGRGGSGAGVSVVVVGGSGRG